MLNVQSIFQKRLESFDQSINWNGFEWDTDQLMFRVINRNFRDFFFFLLKIISAVSIFTKRSLNCEHHCIFL